MDQIECVSSDGVHVQATITGEGRPLILLPGGIDRSRARGASRWGAHMWLHVSAGLGTAPTAPVRFACPPEASLLTLVPRPTGPATAPTTPAKAVADVG